MQLSGKAKAGLRTRETHHLLMKECFSAEGAWRESVYENSAKSCNMAQCHTDSCSSPQSSTLLLCFSVATF